METIKLLLACADRRASNMVEVAVLDICYDRAAVESTRTSRLDDFVRQGSLWDFDLIVLGADDLFQDRRQEGSAAATEVAKGIEAIRVQHNTPIVALTASSEAGQLLVEAGADVVLPLPLNADQLKTELRALLDLSEFVEDGETSRWPGLNSILRGFQRTKAAS